jgi:4-hydroxybenzoate polyprenyltransferase
MISKQTGRKAAAGFTAVVSAWGVYLLATAGTKIAAVLAAACASFVLVTWAEAWRTRDTPWVSDLLLGYAFAIAVMFSMMAEHVNSLARAACP